MNAARLLAGLALSLALAAPAQAQLVASALAVGGTHNCVVTPAGGVKCWGYNAEGELGDGTLVDKSTPVDVPGLTNVVAIAAGVRHTCVITTAGTVKCWGYNFNGQLGDNTTTTRTSPVDVGGGLTGVVSIAAGSGNTCALTSAGGVKCWGANFRGQAGNGDLTGVNRTLPVNVTGLTSGVIAIASNSDANCALTASGTVKCWGDNNGGGLGDGNNQVSQRNTPVDVVGVTGATAIFGGSNADHLCVRVANGSIKCWGNNADGQLGIGSFESPDPTVPGIAVSLPAPVTSASLSSWYTCAAAGGAVSCWGRNESGELGDGGAARNAPSTMAIASGIASVGAGGSHACALTLAGAVYCWGNGFGGANGDGTTTSRPTPVEVTGFKPVITTMALGSSHTCAAGVGGTMWCLGYGFNGTLGDNSFSSSTTAVMPIGFTTGTGSIAAGSEFTCGIVSGSLKCWGQSNTGQVGDNNIGIRAQPSSVVSLPTSPQMVAAGTLHACTVLASGAVYCWGSNLSGAIGRDLSVGQFVLSPFAVPSLTSGVARITTGNFHTCIVNTGGGVKCWGDNSAGQLGNNTTNNTITPTDVTGLTSGVATVQGGNNFTCARTTASAVKCWGDNVYGQVGDGTNTRRLTATNVSGLASGVAAIATGLHHACALLNTGDVKCWGENADGQLGDGTTTNRNVPTAVTGLGGRAVSLSTGYRHTCAILQSGLMRCWGYNDSSQLGDGTTTSRSTPAYAVIGTQAIDFSPPASVTSGYTLSATATSGKPVSFQTWTSGCSISGNILTATPPAVCGVRAVQAGSVAVNAAPFQLRSIAIIASQTITFPAISDSTVIGNSRALPTITSSSGLTVTVTTLTPSICTLAGSNVNQIAVGDCTLAANQAGNGAFAAAPQVTQTFKIRNAQNITFAAIAGKTFGDPNVNVSPTALGGIPVAVTSLTQGACVVISSSVTILHAGTCTLRASTVETSTYAAATRDVTFEIAKHGSSIAFGGIPSQANVGFVPVQFFITPNPGSVTVPLSASPPSVCVVVNSGLAQLIAAGTCTLTATFAGTVDLLGSAASINVTVLANSQGINFGGLSSRLMGDAPFTVNAFASSGLPVTFTSRTTSICTVSGNTVTLVAPGLCTIRASQPGDTAHFLAAADVDQSFQVINPPFRVVAGYRMGEDDVGATIGAQGAGATIPSPGTVSLLRQGPAQYAPGAVGNGVGMLLDGSGGYFANSAVMSATDNFGIEMWVKSAGATSGGNLLAYIGQPGLSGYGIGRNGASYVGVFGDGAPKFIGGAPLSAGAWTHLALVRTDGHARFYVNGVETGANDAAPVDPAAFPSAFTAIGFNPMDNGGFDGAVDEVRFFTFEPGQFNVSRLNQRTLTVTKSGSGGGAVASSLGAISCGATCSAPYPTGTVVTLEAVASGGATFAGWSGGGCSGTGSCVVTLDDAVSVTAAFAGGTPPAANPFDFNGDGKADLIWSNTTNGATYFWYMNGASLITDAFVTTIDPSWVVQGVADFNGDGHPDLVWRNTATGNTYVWYMNGTTLISDAFLFSLPPEWVIQGVVDFNGDGKPDFLMRNTTSGNAFVWFFNDATAVSDQFLFGIDPVWKVEAVGDFNGDGKPDLLFRNQVSGLAFAWYSQFTTGVLSLGDSSDPIFGIDPAWEVVQVADYNGDGKPDLVFRNRISGLVFVWYLNGITLGASDFITQIDPSWEVVPHR